MIRRIVPMINVRSSSVCEKFTLIADSSPADMGFQVRQHLPHISVQPT